MFHEDLADVDRLHRLHRLIQIIERGAGIVLDHVKGGSGHRAAVLSPQAHAELALEDVLLLVPRRITEPVQSA